MGGGRRETGEKTQGQGRKAAGGRWEEAEGGGETGDGRHGRLSSGSVAGMSMEFHWNVIGSLDVY